MDKIYVSGAITGVKDYKAKFRKASDQLSKVGWEVVNPAEVRIPNGTWEDYMRHDVKLLLGCKAVFMLKGWKSSKGAKLEHLIASKLGLKILKQESINQVPVPEGA